MRQNLTISADADTIRRAREKAKGCGTSLNAQMRQYLEQLAGNATAADRYRKLMDDLSDVNSGGPFTREEMNER